MPGFQSGRLTRAASAVAVVLLGDATAQESAPFRTHNLNPHIWLAVLVACVVVACGPTGPAPGSGPERGPESLDDGTPGQLRDAATAPAAAASNATVRDGGPADSQRTVASGIAGEAAEYLSSPLFAAADLERGRILSLACQACHTLGAGEEHNLGPNLHGMFGRPAAQLEGFEYSEALRASGLVWTPQVLEAWLAEPDAFLPGNNMVFAGYGAESDRRDLLAWLLTATRGLEP